MDSHVVVLVEGLTVILAQLKAYGWQLAALALAVMLFVQSGARHAAELDAQTTRTTLATERGNSHRAALQASEKYRKIEGEHREAISKIGAAASAAIAAADADAGRARAAHDGMQRDLADYITAHRRAAEARAAAGQCTPDTAAINLLADLQRRADQRAGELAAIADTARARGTGCERSHDAAEAMSRAAAQ